MLALLQALVRVDVGAELARAQGQVGHFLLAHLVDTLHRAGNGPVVIQHEGLRAHRQIDLAALRHALQWGLRRSAFSNEAGLGSAAIAHASADTSSAPEQGLWGIFEVFADTVVICSLTAFAILCSGVDIPWGHPVGGELFSAALITVFGKGCSLLFMALSLLLFAMSSVLGWALYGSCCVKYLYGSTAVVPYRVLFAAAVYASCVMSTELVWAMADCFNALMSVPNFIALFALSGQVEKVTREGFSL